MFTRKDRDYVDQPTDERVATEDRQPLSSDQPTATVREERVQRRNTEPAAAAMYDSDVTESRGFLFDSIAGRVNSVMFAVLLALETLLGLRFLMKAFGANESSGFVSGVYAWAHPFTRPFNNAFTNRTWDQGIVEINTLLAMGVYLLAFALVAVLVNATLPHHDTMDTTTSQRRRHVTHA
jgi:hypothetical protein